MVRFASFECLMPVERPAVLKPVRFLSGFAASAKCPVPLNFYPPIAHSAARRGRLQTLHGASKRRSSCRSARKARSRRSRRRICTRSARRSSWATPITSTCGRDRRLVRELGGLAQIHGLGRPDPDRQRRIPSFQPGETARHPRRRHRLPVAHRRRETFPRPARGHDDPGQSRLGHRDGDR